MALYEAEAYAMGHLFTSLSELATARSVVSPLDTSLTHSVAALFGCKRAIRKFDFALESNLFTFQSFLVSSDRNSIMRYLS